MRKQPLWLMVLLVSLSLFQSRAAGAATVIIVGPVNGPPVMVETMVRLKGELTSAGFDTQIVDAPPVAANSDGGSRTALEQMASRRAADALLAIVGAPAMTNGAPHSVEVWVVDNVTGKSVVRRIPFEPASASASKTLAIRAIELLRSSFLEIDLAAHARPSSGAAPPPPPAAVVELVNAGNPAHHRTRRVGVEVGGAALMSLDGVGPAVLPVLRVDWSLRSWLLVQATVAGLGTRPTVTRQVGSADVAQAYGLVGGSLCLRGGEHWRPFATLSAGALETSVDGRANAPNLGHSVGQWSFLVDLGLDVARNLPEPLFLSLGAHAQLAEPSVGVRFADSIVATSGLPNLVVTATVGAWL
ncbi:MAG: hypothetical protein ACJ8F1_13260 [Polyangia bacterium]